MTLDDDTRGALRTAVDHEPAFQLDLTTITDRGSALRRRRRLGRAAGVVAIAGVVGAAALWFPWRAPAPTGTLATGTGSSAAPASSAASTGPVAPAPRTALARTVQAASPGGWSFTWSDENAAGVDGTADDGSGPGRIMVGVSTGTQQVHPCTDPEFRAGASCSERTLPSGAVLSSRGLAVDTANLENYLVALTYPDGSGYNAEAGNYVLPEAPAVLSSTSPKPVPTVWRAHPTYTLAQLEAVVLAVDSARR